jgi:mxaD protein
LDSSRIRRRRIGWAIGQGCPIHLMERTQSGDDVNDPARHVALEVERLEDVVALLLDNDCSPFQANVDQREHRPITSPNGPLDSGPVRSSRTIRTATSLNSSKRGAVFSTSMTRARSAALVAKCRRETPSAGVEYTTSAFFARCPAERMSDRLRWERLRIGSVGSIKTCPFDAVSGRPINHQSSGETAMPEVTETARLKLNADAAWRRIGDFGVVGEWHPMLAKVESEGNAPGALRHVETTEGDKQIERLEDYDSSRHVYRYSMQVTALPIRDYSAEFRIDDDVAGESIVKWSAHFDVASGDPRQGIDMIRQFIKTGTDALAEKYG